VNSALKFAIIPLIALVLFLLPGGDAALRVALTLLTIAFFASIAWFGWIILRRNRMEIETLGDRQRFVLYGSVGLAFLTFTATNQLFDEGGAGVMVWLLLLGLASYGVFWVWTQYRSYE
jgi:hypothetical protein